MAEGGRKERTRIALIGASGRLGSAIREIIEKEKISEVDLCLSVGRSNRDVLIKNRDIDVVLDVSLPASTESLLQEFMKNDSAVPYVVGCTGWNDEQFKTVVEYSKIAPVVFAPNFSPGVNLFLGLVEQAAPLLAKWGYDVSVHETHHTRKLDAPSGTAKAIVERLGTMAAQVHATRAGNIVGTHEVRFFGPADIVSLSHEALDRSIFARGAVMAALWVARGQKPGLHSMKQVIFASG